jgi:hypothetical protein
MIVKDRLRTIRVNSELLEVLAHQVRCFGPKWADPLLSALTLEEDAGRWHQTQVGSLETNDFANAGTGIEQEADQHHVAAAVSRGAVNGIQDGLDFGQVQMLDFPSRHAFEGNAQHALDLFEMLRM